MQRISEAHGQDHGRKELRGARGGSPVGDIEASCLQHSYEILGKPERKHQDWFDGCDDKLSSVHSWKTNGPHASSSSE